MIWPAPRIAAPAEDTRRRAIHRHHSNDQAQRRRPRLRSDPLRRIHGPQDDPGAACAKSAPPPAGNWCADRRSAATWPISIPTTTSGSSALAAEQMTGADLSKIHRHIDTATAVGSRVAYTIQHAATTRAGGPACPKFRGVPREAAAAARSGKKASLRISRPLMYASHQSYTHDAMLGAEECDCL